MVLWIFSKMILKLKTKTNKQVNTYNETNLLVDKM